jgi:hypothetical protein
MWVSWFPLFSGGVRRRVIGGNCLDRSCSWRDKDNGSRASAAGARSPAEDAKDFFQLFVGEGGRDPARGEIVGFELKPDAEPVFDFARHIAERRVLENEGATQPGKMRQHVVHGLDGGMAAGQDFSECAPAQLDPVPSGTELHLPLHHEDPDVPE